MSQPPTNYQPAYAPQPTGPRPNPHWGWAVVAIIFCWPLCIPAFVFASRVDWLYDEGSVSQSEQSSKLAKLFGLIALIVGLVLLVIIIIASIAAARAYNG